MASMVICTSLQVLTVVTVNSLPENASILVNHRIAIQDSVQAVKDHYVQLLAPWVEERGFRFHAFGTKTPHENGTCTPPTNTSDCGDLTLSAQYELESSPVSSAEDPRFALLASTIKGVFGNEVVVAPEVSKPQYLWRIDKLFSGPRSIPPYGQRLTPF